MRPRDGASHCRFHCLCDRGDERRNTAKNFHRPARKYPRDQLIGPVHRKIHSNSKLQDMLGTCCRKKYFGISYGRAQTFYSFRSLLVQFFYNSLSLRCYHSPSHF